MARRRAQESLKGTKEVLAHLQEEGWKVSRTSLYQHVKDAKLRPDQEGSFTLDTAQACLRTGARD